MEGYYGVNFRPRGASSRSRSYQSAGKRSFQCRNADALKKTIASVVEGFGCRTCFSGADCQFSLERNLSVDKHGKVELNPQPLPPGIAATPNPWPWSVSVAFQGRAAFNIEQVYQAVDRVAGLLGCLPCHSGFDVSYWNEVILIGVDQNGQAQRYGGQISE